MIVKVVGFPAECLSAIFVHRRVTDSLAWTHRGLGHLAAEYGLAVLGIEQAVRARTNPWQNPYFLDTNLVGCKDATEPIGKFIGLTSCTVFVIKRLDETEKVRCRSKQDQNMEDLMRAAPDVESAGPQTFWKSSLCF